MRSFESLYQEKENRKNQTLLVKYIGPFHLLHWSESVMGLHQLQRELESLFFQVLRKQRGTNMVNASNIWLYPYHIMSPFLNSFANYNGNGDNNNDNDGDDIWSP